MTDLKINILLVEDNQGDIRLTKESFKECKINNGLNVVTNGETAIRYLNREGEYKDVEMPDLILLDLNIPGIKGLEVLSYIKSSNALKHIPVVILTASEGEKDIVRSYNNHANCYICKPIDLDQFVMVVRTITNFWFSIVKLPPKENDENNKPVSG